VIDNAGDWPTPGTRPYDRRIVQRFLAPLAVLLAVALGATGCNLASTPSVAARVNGSNITTATLDSVLSTLKTDHAFLCLSGAGSNPPTTGVGTGTWNEVYAGFVLAQLVKFEVLRQIVAAHHLDVPRSDLTTAAAEVESGISGTGQTGCGTAQSALQSAGTTFETALLDSQLDQDAYSAYLAGTSLQPTALLSWARSHPASTDESCTSVIQVTSKSLAVKIDRAIRAGASFAAEATKYTTNTGTGKGGSVGCVLEQSWVAGLGPIVAALHVGAVSAPVSYQSGWLLFSVTSRVLEPASGLVTLLEEQEITSFNRQYASALTHDDITVSPAYGSWSVVLTKTGLDVSIVPPANKACAYAVKAAAAGCATSGTAAVGTAGSG
jgi:hypothetical protein